MCELFLPVYDVSASKSKNRTYFYPRREQNYDVSNFYPRFSEK